jgi:hypothetical protein
MSMPIRRMQARWIPIVGAASLALTAALVVNLSGVTPGSPVTTAAAAPIGPPAATATDAVRRYLDAESTGAWADSYTQLSAADRVAYGKIDDWTYAADERLVYTAYRILESADDTVVVEVHPKPLVSEIKGVAPLTERIEFAVVPEDGGYRIALADTTSTATYPAPEPASDVAADWVTGYQACSPATSSLEYDGNLLGTLDLPQSLCGAVGKPQVTGAGGLDELSDPSPVLSAFGEQATDWARVVEIGGFTDRAPVQVILAPLGEQWVVVGGIAGSVPAGG